MILVDFQKALPQGLAVELRWDFGEQITPQNFSTGKPSTGGGSLYLMSRASTPASFSLEAKPAGLMHDA